MFRSLFLALHATAPAFAHGSEAFLLVVPLLAIALGILIPLLFYCARQFKRSGPLGRIVTGLLGTVCVLAIGYILTIFALGVWNDFVPTLRRRN